MNDQNNNHQHNDLRNNSREYSQNQSQNNLRNVNMTDSFDINMFNKVNVPVIGIIENMSYFICDKCNQRHEIFSYGGAKNEAKKLDTEFLGEVPLDKNLRISSDEGKPIGIFNQNSDIAKKYWYLSVPSGALSGLVSFMLIHNQVGWDSWYWSIIAGVVGFLFAFLYSVPFLVIALVIGVIWSVVKGINFLQDKGVLENKIEEQVIEDKVEDGVKNRQEKAPAREDMGIWEADKKEVLQ